MKPGHVATLKEAVKLGLLGYRAYRGDPAAVKELALKVVSQFESGRGGGPSR